jgi:hypothetical protein
MRFTQFVNENIYYHGTSSETASLILKNGIDVDKYKSGMFQGFYLTPNLQYFQINKPQAILQFDIDDNQIIDVKNVSDIELSKLDPHFKMMSYGWKNHLITQYALQNGFSGVRNGNEVILFKNNPIKSVKLME